ncbi:MAG: SH3 domain-containing protein [Chloroflexota bacterium]
MRRNSRGGPPAILAFLLAAALVFGVYYIWQGVQTYLRTGGLGVVESTARAQEVDTATAAGVTRRATLPATLLPTATAPPPCQDFSVIVPAAIVREGPSTSAAVKTQYKEGTIVCVLGQDAGSEWYSIDMNPATKRIELGYMNEVLIEAAYPTLTPSITLTPSNTVSPPPTVTNVPTERPSATSTNIPTATRDPRLTNTPYPTATATPTASDTPQLFQSA